MPFTIVNEPTAAFGDQSDVDTVDIDILVAGLRGNGVVSGCVVASTGAANGSVTVSSGVIRVDDQLYTVTGNTIVIAANATGNPRYDLITVPTTGTPVRTAGTAAAQPIFPTFTGIALASVRVPNGHTTGTTIPANTITDKRILVTKTIAAPADLSAYFALVAPDDDRATFRVYGGTGGGGTQNFQIIEVLDYLGAPIATINTAGGIWVNDYIRTSYSVYGPDNSMFDIYGAAWQGKQCSYAFDGPPGNMLTFANACQENHQLARNATLGNWSAVGGCTIATVDLGVPVTAKTRLRSAIRMTATGTTPWISQPGGVFALSGITAGRPLSGVAWMKSATAAASRTFNVRFTFYTAAGATVGSDVNGTSVSVPNTGVWTMLPLDGTIIPATATLVAIQIIGTVVSGETFDVAGVGVMKNAQTATFAPPFVFQDATTGGASPAGEGVALVGARWRNTATPNVPGTRDFVSTTGGAPNLQEWVAVDTSSLYRLEADVTSTSTTAAAVAQFAVPVLVNSSYSLDYDLFITTAAITTGWLIGFTGPASPTYFYAVCEYQSSATAWTTATIQSLTTFTLVTAAYVATPNIIRVRIKAQLVNGANAGLLNLTWATEVAASAAVIKKGSTLQVT